MENRFVYLDFAASAPVREVAVQAAADYRAKPFAGANPNSLHSMGRAAARELDAARTTLVRCLGGGFRPSDVVFTSGGTESNNLALMGLARFARSRDRKRVRVLLSSIEHDSVLDMTGSLKADGFEVQAIPCGRDGRVSAEALADMMGSDVALVSVMAANNETGVVQDTDALAGVAHTAGAFFHTDAVQAFGRIPLSVDAADAVSIAGHKFGAPVGTGALFVRSRLKIRPLSFGGGQESGRRAGTQDVCGAVALAAAAKFVCDRLDDTRELVSARASEVYKRLCAEGTGIVPTTSDVVDDGRLPGLVSVLVEGVDSQNLVLKLDDEGYEVSAGSACSSGAADPSHVLVAMGIPRKQAMGSLRISFDERVSREDLMGFCDALIALVDATA